MGYDRFAEQVIDEKIELLNDLLPRHGRLFYTHDDKVAISGIQKDDKGKFSAVEPLGDFVDLAS
jgi:hypothetical protein